MNIDNLLYVSATGQLALAVLQGWPIVMHGPGTWTERLFPDRRRLLQSHIDNLMMGTIQIALAASTLPIADWMSWLIVGGSWVNAQLFLYMAVRGPKFRGGGVIRPMTILSFSALTLAYCGLFVSTILASI